jgi:hypothetical protein
LILKIVDAESAEPDLNEIELFLKEKLLGNCKEK